MKPQWTVLFFTLALHGAGISAILLADKFGYRRGANDMGQSLLTFAIVALIIGVFFIRTVYQAIAVDASYWLVAALHVVCIFIFIYYFMI